MVKQVVIFHYELKGDKGEVIDSSKGREPIEFLEGSGQIIPGLEEILLELQKGTTTEVTISYKDAYGSYDQTLVTQIPRSQFPPGELKAGDMFQVEKNGTVQMITVVVATDSMVTIDGNHPMAGKNLNFFLEILDRRDATSEEVAHGHVHGKGGHHH